MPVCVPKNHGVISGLTRIYFPQKGASGVEFMFGELLYLSRADVERVALPMSEIIDLVERAFREKGGGFVELPPKPGLHPAGDAFIHAMPAWLSRLGVAGMKWVSGYPQNQARGLPYITGLIILNDPETGIPRAVMDCTWVTAVRTAAATAVSAKYLARTDAQVMGILGLGVQGRANLEAVRCVRDIAEVRCYDINADRQAAFVKEMSERTGIRIVPARTPREAVEGCDIVVTAGPILRHPQPVIEPDWLSPGVLAVPLDFDSYFTPASMRAVDLFVTDDTPQYLYYREHGYFQGCPDPHADLGDVVTGKGQAQRKQASERIMSMNLGLAIEDMVVADAVYRRAASQDLGVRLAL